MQPVVAPAGTRAPETRRVAAWDGPTGRRSTAQRVQLAVTLLIVTVPIAGIAVMALPWLGGVTWVNLGFLAGFYVVTGLGVTVGFHRLFTHRSFTARRPLRIGLAIAGSLSFEGGVISWVATHRRHHAFSDRPGDPHSPYRYGDSGWAQIRGMAHAHLGWLLRSDPTPVARYAPDMAADPAMRIIDRAFPGIAGLSLAVPMLLGWALTRTLHGAVSALIWGGLLRVFLLQHVTWSVNSLCHVIGARPFKTRREDRASNLWPLALVSFGDSYHNFHHADPSSARHGVGPRDVDVAAGFIRCCERLGWATRVQWPSGPRIEAHRRQE